MSSAPGSLLPALRRVLQFGCIAVATLVCFWPALSLGWIWDDDQYINANPLLQYNGGLYAIWFEPEQSPQYYPVVFTTLWTLYQFVADSPPSYHALNLILHLINAGLVFAILIRLNVKAAFWIAFAFALHPIQVETVAWATEIKNLLSGVFYGSAWLVLWPTLDSVEDDEEKPTSNKQTGLRIALGCLLFVAALLSKSVTASLPAGMLVALWFQRGKITRWQLSILLPMLVLGAAVGWNTARLERLHVGALGADWDYVILERCGIAARCLVHYGVQSAVPTEQVFFYPRFEPTLNMSAWLSIAICVAVLLTALYYAFRPNHPNQERNGASWNRRGPLACLLFFAGSAFPALGFLNVYPHRFSFVADHFVYIPIVGLLALIWSSLAAIRNAAARKWKLPSYLSHILLTLVLAIYGYQTHSYLPVFSNERTLWEDTLAKNPNCTAAMQNLGLFYFQQGDAEQALELLTRAEEYSFDRFQTLNSKGMVLGSLERYSEARLAFQESVKLNPNNPMPWVNLGNLERRLASQGVNSESELSATKCYRNAWDVKPDYFAAFALGTIAYEQGQKGQAADWYGRASTLRPRDLDSKFNLAQCQYELGELQLAKTTCEQLLKIYPRDKPTLSLLRKLR